MDAPVKLAHDLLETALLAVRGHDGQRRKGHDAPYAEHPMRVALRVLRLEGYALEQRITMAQAALCHDLLEDTEVSAAEIEALCGPEVLGLVRELTQEMSLPKAERKRLMLEELAGHSPLARTIKLADRLDNVRGLSGMSASFRARYLPESRELLHRLRGTCPELESELAEAIEEAARL